MPEPNLNGSSQGEVKRKFDALIKDARKGNVGKHDWKALFAEWLICDDKTLAAFCKRKGLHKGSIQKRGGRMFWHEAREAVRTKALRTAMDKAPEALVKKYEKQLRIVGKLEDVIERDADHLLTSSLSDPRRHDKLGKLADAVKTLADTNLRLQGDDVQKHEVRSVNIHAEIVDAIEAEGDTYDIEPDRSPAS